MTQDDFLCGTFRDSEDIIINANELQKTIRESRKNEREVLSLQREVLRLKSRLSNMITKVEVMQLQQPLRVDLTA